MQRIPGMTTKKQIPKRKGKAKVHLLQLELLGISPVDLEQSEAAEYGDSSTMYWELYASEAKINDQKFVDTLIGDTRALSILVRGNERAPHSLLTHSHPTEWHILFHNCGFSPTSVTGSSAKQQPGNRLLIVTARFAWKLHPSTATILSGSLPWGAIGSACSIKYSTRHQLLLGYGGRHGVWAYPPTVR